MNFERLLSLIHHFSKDGVLENVIIENSYFLSVPKGYNIIEVRREYKVKKIFWNLSFYDWEDIVYICGVRVKNSFINNNIFN